MVEVSYGWPVWLHLLVWLPLAVLLCLALMRPLKGAARLRSSSSIGAMSSTPADAGRRFRPRLWPTLRTLLALAVLLALGTWQVQRLAWKTELIARRASRSWPPVAMPMPPGRPRPAPTSATSRRAGTYLHDPAFAFGLSRRAAASRAAG